MSRAAFTLALAFVIAPGAHAQRGSAPAEPFPAELDRYIAKALQDWQIPGLAIAVVRNDSVLVAKGYGVRELGKPAVVDEHTVFDIASLSKSFTATAAAILIDRGKLRWDDPVRRHLPTLRLPTPELDSSMTARDFLSHRSGLEAANPMWVYTDVDRAEVLRRARYLRVATPPRRAMLYSNVGYAIASDAIAAAAGMSFDAVLRDLLIKPLGLTNTTWTYEQSAAMPNIASAHATIDGRQQPVRRETQRRSIGGAAAVQSSVADLTRWMRLHLNNGVLDGRRFVSDSTMREMHSMQVVIPTTPAMRAARQVYDTVAGYGLGLQVMDYRGHPLLWHTGNGDGQIAYMSLLPRDRLGVVVVVNTWSAGQIHLLLANRIIDTYLGFEPRDWAGEALARFPQSLRAQDSIRREIDAMRTDAPPPFSLAAYVGRYDEPLYGPLWIRLEGNGLTVQMGKGQIGNLEYHGGNSFFIRWRDPVFRETAGSHLTFTSEDGSIVSLSNDAVRNQYSAKKGKP